VKGERDDFGRLDVSDEELAAHHRGALIAASLSVQAIERLLGCDRFEAQAFQEGAVIDLRRITAWGNS